MADRLNPNESLLIGSSMTSQDGRFTLNMQGDGNLVLYGPNGKYRWDSATNGQSVTQTVMQSDGNFVIYGPGGALWASGTYGLPEPGWSCKMMEIWSFTTHREILSGPRAPIYIALTFQDFCRPPQGFTLRILFQRCHTSPLIFSVSRFPSGMRPTACAVGWRSRPEITLKRESPFRTKPQVLRPVLYLITS